MINAVSRLINQVGQDVTVKRVTSTYSSSTRTNSLTESSNSVKAYVSNHASGKIIGLSKQAKKLVYIPSKDLGFRPESNKDKIIIDSEEHTILSVDNRKISNDSAMYVIEIKSDG